MARIIMQPSGKSVDCAYGDTVLMALEKAGYALPNNCRAGACGECKVKVTQGQFDQGMVLDMALSQDERKQGYGLMCMAKPISSVLEIEWGTDDAKPKLFPPNENIYYVVTDKVPRTPRIVEITMRPLGKPMRYWPGQNMMIGDNFAGAPARCYSIANAPRADGELVFHVTRVDDGATSRWLHDKVKVGDQIRLAHRGGQHFEPRARLGVIAAQAPKDRPHLGGAGPDLAGKPVDVAACQQFQPLKHAFHDPAEFFGIPRLQPQALGQIARKKARRFGPRLQAGQHGFGRSQICPGLARDVLHGAAQPAGRLQRANQSFGDARLLRVKVHDRDHLQHMRNQALRRRCGLWPVIARCKSRLPARQPVLHRRPCQHKLRVLGRQLFQLLGQAFGIGAQNPDRGQKPRRQRHPLRLLYRDPASRHPALSPLPYSGMVSTKHPLAQVLVSTAGIGPRPRRTDQAKTPSQYHRSATAPPWP